MYIISPEWQCSNSLALFAVLFCFLAILNVDEADVVKPQVDAERNCLDAALKDLQHEKAMLKHKLSTKTVQQCAGIPDEEQDSACTAKYCTLTRTTIALSPNVQLYGGAPDFCTDVKNNI